MTTCLVLTDHELATLRCAARQGKSLTAATKETPYSTFGVKSALQRQDPDTLRMFRRTFVQSRPQEGIRHLDAEGVFPVQVRTKYCAVQVKWLTKEWRVSA